MLGIGNFDKVNTRKVVTREGQKLYMGKKYAIEQKTGYYVCTTGKRERLHIVKYREEVLGGREVPPGCVIHHLDWNKSNNNVENLICVSIEEHERIHNIIGGEAGKALGYELVKNRVNGLPPDIKI